MARFFLDGLIIPVAVKQNYDVSIIVIDKTFSCENLAIIICFFLIH